MIFYLISVLESSSSDQHNKTAAGRVGGGNHGNTGYSSGNESADASLGEVYIIDAYHVIWNVHTESDGGEGLGLRTPNLSDVIYEYSNITLLLVICFSFESSNKVTHITPKIILFTLYDFNILHITQLDPAPQIPSIPELHGLRTGLHYKPKDHVIGHFRSAKLENRGNQTVS